MGWAETLSGFRLGDGGEVVYSEINGRKIVVHGRGQAVERAESDKTACHLGSEGEQVTGVPFHVPIRPLLVMTWCTVRVYVIQGILSCVEGRE